MHNGRVHDTNGIPLIYWVYLHMLPAILKARWTATEISTLSDI